MKLTIRQKRILEVVNKHGRANFTGTRNDNAIDPMVKAGLIHCTFTYNKDVIQMSVISNEEFNK